MKEFEKLSDEDAGFVGKRVKCGDMRCENPPKYWWKFVGIYVCEDCKKKIDKKINENLGIS